ncbi:MAG TPA: hypothetical protein VFO07_13095 [Roseiflexaceae bacterium]|nr:hypothetical protein [Roseiflexaceae bacterium]
MEDHLQDIVAGRAAHTLTITYSDVHGLWGGVAVTLTTHGAYERLGYLRGASAPDVVRGMLAPARIQEVVRLLLEVKAWEQRTPQRAPVPDESRATLMLRAGEAASSTWEWYNDLTPNARLIRVRDLLVALAADLAET